MEAEVSQKVKQFFGQYQSRHYAKGQILIHAQDNPEAIYYLEQGAVKQYDISYRGDEVVLNVFKAPAFFPMSYAINKTPNSYFFQADSEVMLRLAPIDAVVEFVKSNPDVMYDLLARVYRGTDGLLGRMGHLMASSARSRVLYELLIESRRFGHEASGGVIITLSESDIGGRSGLTRETVNREIRKLKADGLIDVDKNQLIILDPGKLAGLIGQSL